MNIKQVRKLQTGDSPHNCLEAMIAQGYLEAYEKAQRLVKALDLIGVDMQALKKINRKHFITIILKALANYEKDA